MVLGPESLVIGHQFGLPSPASVLSNRYRHARSIDSIRRRDDSCAPRTTPGDLPRRRIEIDHVRIRRPAQTPARRHVVVAAVPAPRRPRRRGLTNRDEDHCRADEDRRAAARARWIDDEAARGGRDDDGQRDERRGKSAHVNLSDWGHQTTSFAALHREANAIDEQRRRQPWNCAPRHRLAGSGAWVRCPSPLGRVSFRGHARYKLTRSTGSDPRPTRTAAPASDESSTRDEPGDNRRRAPPARG